MKVNELDDHEVLAVTAWLSLKWPRPLPSLGEDVHAEAARVDQAAERMGVDAWQQPLDDEVRAHVEAILAVIDGKDAAAMYGHDTDGTLLAWSVLNWFGESHAAVETVVAATGQHTFTVGSRSEARAEFTNLAKHAFDSGHLMSTSIASLVVVPVNAENEALVVTHGTLTHVVEDPDGELTSSVYAEWDESLLAALLDARTIEGGEG